MWLHRSHDDFERHLTDDFTPAECIGIDGQRHAPEDLQHG
jgi:hypothetical protein